MMPSSGPLSATTMQRLLLLDAERFGNRIVAVGDRGYIVLSDDHGASWRRAKAPMPRFRGPVLTHHPGMTVDGLLRRFAPRNDDGRNNNKCGGYA